jgi:hypothetical protein
MAKVNHFHYRGRRDDAAGAPSIRGARSSAFSRCLSDLHGEVGTVEVAAENALGRKRPDDLVGSGGAITCGQPRNCVPARVRV